VTGNAVLKAARALRNRLEAIARKMLGEEDLVFVDEEIFSERHPEKRISFASLAKEGHLRGAAWWRPTGTILRRDVDRETGQGNAYSNYSFATQLAEVEVDTETGKVEVLRVIAATDVERPSIPRAWRVRLRAAW